MRELTTTILHDSFAGSPYGRDLAERTRFNDFKPDFVGTRTWGHLLGRDVNNLHHMPKTAEHAASFGAHNKLDWDIRRELAVVAFTHDWGEAIIGDIALPSKTAEDEKREFVAHREIAGKLFGQQGQELSERVWRVLGHEDEELGDMFRAVEYVGYCTTAMRAGRVATALAHGFVRLPITRPEKEQLMGGLLALEKAVSVRNFPILEKYIDKYPGIEQQLWEYREEQS
jgi:hypothetical protein